ncbi:hypothetical protein C2E31_15245 [Rhodopirellula baltica]|nr:hypothetical protein C2E31_15245 [Rhodopirellula baltica]
MLGTPSLMRPVWSLPRGKPSVTRERLSFESEVVPVLVERTGHLDKIEVQAGEPVEAGQTVAVFSQPVDDAELERLEKEIESVERYIDEQQQELVSLRQSDPSGPVRNDGNAQAQVRICQAEVDAARERMVELEEEARRLVPLVRLHKVSREQAMELSRKFEQTELQLVQRELKLRKALMAVSDDVVETPQEVWQGSKEDKERSIAYIESSIRESEEYLLTLKSKLQSIEKRTVSWTFVSPVTGIVQSVDANVDDLVSDGAPLVTIRRMNPQHATVGIPEQFAQKLSVGGEFTVYVPRLAWGQTAKVRSLRHEDDETWAEIDIVEPDETISADLRETEEVEVWLMR